MSDAGKPIRILIVDDHEVVHWGFRLLFEHQAWVSESRVANSAEQALAMVREMLPQVALVDLFLGAQSGAEVCEQLRAASPETRVLLISGAGTISPAVARAAGASGFVSKDLGAKDIVRAVRMVSLGIDVFEPGETAQPSTLSERERQVVLLIARGSTNREIAAELHLSAHTIKEYTSSIYRKLGVRNRAEAVQHAQRLGLIA